MAYRKILLEGDAPSFDTDKIHIQLFSTQSQTTIKSDPPTTVNVTNVGIIPVGIGNAVLVRLDDFTKLRLLVVGANSVGQTGTVTIDIFSQTDGVPYISLSFSDSIIQTREAVVVGSVSGVKRLYARIRSTIFNDDPRIGEIAIQLEK